MAKIRRFSLQTLLVVSALLLSCIVFSCEKKKVIVSFSPLEIPAGQGDSLFIPMDLSGNIFRGVCLPGNTPEGPGHFTMRAELLNNEDKPQRLHYKIYYQNETYKFHEWLDTAMAYNPESGDNFYGSWTEASEGFHSTGEIAPGETFAVTDSFRIQGNPRDEKRYVGTPAIHLVADSLAVDRTIKIIRNSKDWMAMVHRKAVDSKTTDDEQLRREALWVHANPASDRSENNRWQRNPRTGKYRFLLVVCTDEGLARIPSYISDIRLKGPDSVFVNPWWYFLHGPGAWLEGVSTELSKVKLQTSASFNLAAGIHVPCLKHPDGLCNSRTYTSNCGDSDSLFENAQFSQLFHHLPPGWKLRNIPVLDDVTSDDYTLEDYKAYKEKYPAEEREETMVQVTRFPCTTTWYDMEKKAICIMNPGSETEMRKENVGIMGRIGFTYGKWRAKVKFPDQINVHNMWTGLTHAVWMLYQSEGGWNVRGECNPGGFIPQNSPDPEHAPKVPSYYYSEIDIEMAHESRYWPKSSYGDRTELYKTDDPQNSRDVIISCTNWDLCCHSTPRYVMGATPYEAYKGRYYTLHRWGEWVPAVTLKTPFPQDSLFGNYAWYEIDWQPERIIWRVGLDPKNMQEVGYMDRSVTNIPNNQMVMVVSQEFHYAAWWPLAPQSQDDIPYPTKDFVAEIQEIVVE